MLGVRYEIRQGDTLSKIAKEMFGDASKWRLIFEHNNKPDVKRRLNKPIPDANRIQAGEYLFLPGSTADFQRGSIIIVKDPDGTSRIKDPRAAQKASNVWLGIGEAHSGDLVAIGYFNWNARVYRLHADGERNVEWVNLMSHGYKLGGGLGGSGGLVAVFAHGVEKPSQFNSAFAWGDMDFDLAIVGQLGALLKGVKGIGTVVRTMEKYKKLNYLGQELIKNRAFIKKGVYTIPIPIGAGVHVWVGRKYATTSVEGMGTGL